MLVYSRMPSLVVYEAMQYNAQSLLRGSLYPIRAYVKYGMAMCCRILLGLTIFLNRDDQTKYKA